MSIWRKIADGDFSYGNAVFLPVGFDATCMLKAIEPMMIRLEIMKGKSDVEALYLRFGHSFLLHYRRQISSVHGGIAEYENLFPMSIAKRCSRTVAFALALVPLSASALTPTSTQEHTLKELIDVIEERHYASRRYDDALSAQHFIAYLDALDPQRMFFDATDITEFSSWKMELDNAGRRGNLDPAFFMFNRYHEKLRKRLRGILETLPQTHEGFDYELDEYLVIDNSNMPWAPNPEELDERWRKHLKNQALSLMLADKHTDEIPDT